ncbi:AraC family transcriptional regulator [Pseudomonas mosselii]|uniref:AraC family transcriptional regulator n=1 Tax=Pseudomonas mosselii TaxID=78327 RepID=UPI002448FC4F|nr:AraC family transcriptional regulator [Pseudomonas mosselii]MDH0629942.1 AraC family transcriptional regulator [Pseudomonas mosselii]MDH0679858.1 AraC family transcriptional regulator [Pseudomonas mosselii]MDH0924812.1 AraC family transcriptional regulator [Pseudomonas mosselii]MDH1134627.1 AraC family transcriptional regulator [Pseudomonas mosselii]MDH1138540.1 AraC family transcriptional regulator [Pseudomonas mosselii]
MNKDNSTVLATLTLASTGQLKSWQLRTAKQLMLERLDTCLSVTEIAQACALSRSHFSRMFKESTRMSPQQWLREQRVMKSRELLKTSTMLLAEIALECGFCDQSHFCRTFVKAEGMTPKAWQQQVVCT